ncbi:MAG: transglutaminase family protein [Pirellulales bacterium]|nr:transglutaminase family protein [Pirellulales bacterium]
MMSISRLGALAFCLGALAGSAFADKDRAPIVGEREKSYVLAPENQDVRGLAIDDASPAARLFVLDGSGKLFVYRLPPSPKAKKDELALLQVRDLRKSEPMRSLGGLRGLAFAKKGGEDAVYFLNWEKLNELEDNAHVEENKGLIRSQLWCYNLVKETASSVDLSHYALKLGNLETTAVACRRGELFIAFDPGGLGDRNFRVRRGIVRLKADGAPGKIEFIRHLADSGAAPSQGLACMKLEGADYLWGTVGDRQIYCAEATAGRGLFYFERPKTTEKSTPACGLCFGNDALWVPEGLPGADCVHRVNVTKNLDAAYSGPRILRHLVMDIRTTPHRPSDRAGKVTHYYSRPYDTTPVPSQDIWPDSEKVADLSGAKNAKIEQFTVDPAGDAASRQYMRSVEYADAPSGNYRSRYEIDFWTHIHRKFVYPHRVNTNAAALRGTNYLADDPELYNLKDKRTYDAFFERVKTHIREKYDVPADLKNPYWAARNVLEYIQDNYYYPDTSKQKFAAVDYARKHYDANPGNLKIELSNRGYDQSQIIACSGTSVMIAGAMRYLGIPARWIGTGTQKGPAAWDANKNGLLDAGESAPCTNGHRYTHVWLGSRYGWVAFDGTPTKPDFSDFDPPPPLQPQWRYMNRIAASEIGGKRIIFNIGSELFRPLYREFEYDEKLAARNSCGGDQRYNLQGRFEKPELWNEAGNTITIKNICFLEDVAVSGPKNQTVVNWRLEGAWNLDPAAALAITLQNILPKNQRPRHVATLAESVPCQAATARIDLSPYPPGKYRIAVLKVGDAETGGYSPSFSLE